MINRARPCIDLRGCIYTLTGDYRGASGHYGDPICSAYGASLAGVRALGMHGDYGGDGPGA